MKSMGMIVLVASATAAMAAGNPGAQMQEMVQQQTAAISAVGFFTGTWTGDGWIQMGPQRETFKETETCGPYLGGALMVLEGKGVDTGNPAHVVHHALAVMSWNAQKDEYDFRSYSPPFAGTFPGKLVSPGVFVWSMDGPMGQMKYTITIKDGLWSETGERSADGKTWSPFFAMNLKRSSTAGWP